jgi:hypothetical protein
VLAALAMAGLLLSMGHYLPLYEYIPGITFFRYPSHFLFFHLLCSVWVAAYGMTHLRPSFIKTIVVSFVALDLLSYSLPARFGWADLEFVMDAPGRIHGLEGVSGGTRIFHTAPIFNRMHLWKLISDEDWILFKGVLAPSYGTIYGLREVRSRVTLINRRTADYASRLDVSPPGSPLYDYANVGTIIALTKEGAEKNSPLWGDFSVVTNPHPKSRAFLDNPNPVSIIKDKPGEFIAEATGPGRFVFSESYFPGWKVEIDGKKGPVGIFENTFLAVNLSKGRHQVHFTYRPISFIIGALISSCTMIGVLLYLIWRKGVNVD